LIISKNLITTITMEDEFMGSIIKFPNKEDENIYETVAALIYAITGELIIESDINEFFY